MPNKLGKKNNFNEKDEIWENNSIIFYPWKINKFANIHSFKLFSKIFCLFHEMLWKKFFHVLRTSKVIFHLIAFHNCFSFLPFICEIFWQKNRWRFIWNSIEFYRIWLYLSYLVIVSNIHGFAHLLLILNELRKFNKRNITTIHSKSQVKVVYLTTMDKESYYKKEAPEN